MYKVLPLFKSHYSLGRSILTLEKPKGKIDGKSSVSIFDQLLINELKTLVLVEDNISGLLQASRQCEESKIKLVFGLRIEVVEDVAQKDEASFAKGAKYIILAQNSAGYKPLVKLWSVAAQEGFYYNPRLDFKLLKKYWDKNLRMVVPFYDSFLFENAFYSHTHVPELEPFNPVFLTEDNDLPFDDILLEKVKTYCQKWPMLPAQSIYYHSPEDFVAYIAFRCLHNRGTSQKSTLDKPELEHMGSHTFNFERWLRKELA
jgi:DNA polymerase III alpha subunit